MTAFSFGHKLLLITKNVTLKVQSLVGLLISFTFLFFLRLETLFKLAVWGKTNQTMLCFYSSVEMLHCSNDGIIYRKLYIINSCHLSNAFFQISHSCVMLGWPLPVALYCDLFVEGSWNLIIKQTCRSQCCHNFLEWQLAQSGRQ